MTLEKDRGHPLSGEEGCSVGEQTYSPVEDDRLIDSYNRYFESIMAGSDALRDAAHRLRYQVYCVERKFENPDDNPDGAERDSFDSHAIQSVLIHRPSGMVAGTVRLILPVVDGVGRALPFHRLCADRLANEPGMLPPATTAEISRFSISKQFRARIGDSRWGGDGFGGDGRRIIPHLTLGLMRSIVEMSAGNSITHVCAVMEPALLRLLGRVAVTFNPIGAKIEHHGRRQPCYADLDVLLARVWDDRFDVWEVITGEGRFWAVNRGARIKRRGPAPARSQRGGSFLMSRQTEPAI